jgi:hypothetical protein
VAYAWVFRIGEAFPADDPVARFVTVLAMMSNDVFRSIEPLVTIADGHRDAAGARVALVRYQAAIVYEAEKFLTESRDRFPEIDEFVKAVPDGEALYGAIVHPENAWLKGHRNVTFHYPELSRDKANAGNEEVATALVATARSVSRIDFFSEHDVRFSFADEVAVQSIRDLGEERVRALRRAVLAIPDFAVAAVNAYAATRPPGTFERRA